MKLLFSLGAIFLAAVHQASFVSSTALDGQRKHDSEAHSSFRNNHEGRGHGSIHGGGKLLLE